MSREVERLARVYGDYAASADVQARWNDANPGNRAIAAERRAAMRAQLAKHGFLPLAQRHVLEVGCGSGKTLADLRDLGAAADRLFGIDVLPDRIDEARARNPGVRIECGSAERLPFGDQELDLVVAVTLFSSILDAAMAERIAAEIMRVLRPGGAVLWYDFRYRNPRNPNVRGISEHAIRALFPKLRPDLQSLTLLPPLARRLGRFTPALYPVLARVPLLRGHLLGILRKP